MRTQEPMSIALRELIRAEVIRDGRPGPDPDLDERVERARRHYDAVRGLRRDTTPG